MADQSIQDPPLPRNNSTMSTLRICDNNNTFLATYKKFSSSFPSFASSQELRLFDTKREMHDCSSSGKVVKDCEEGSKHENEPTKIKISCTEKVSSNKPRTSGWERFFKLWKKCSTTKMPSLHSKISRRKSRSARENVDIDRCQINSTWKTFTLADLQRATNNFSKENLIGKGGYAEVYKGCLPDGQLVAVKRLNKGRSEEEEDVLNFLCEIGIIAHVNHPNTAKMIGYGVEGGRYLVLKLSSLGSLGSLLHSSKEKPNWGMRYKIILGTAQGLLYLHENCQRRIIHRDIKADNILLSEDFEPQICDFGLSKWLPKQWSHRNAIKFEGTFGYLAPEYFTHGMVDEKTDVFSFGVLVLEVITGRRALDESRNSLLLWAEPLLQDNAIKELVDPSLGHNYNSKEMDRVILTATMCIHHNPALRPQMSQVIPLLKGYDKKQTCSSGHRKQFFQRTYSEELSYVHEYNSTKYLLDYNQHEKNSFDS
ncbi:hypothetical protein BUALT_Bualt19G0059100 [Buddleja alternifolia]|uniref:non-specific serine/threonine protein kinase n=1 Tax=Buddleja alternifolia TaxID=168488 RepID=A0AAV6W030_9LAMI|nr:hypothetical protein BUALT_Bualt19G0059100 [Buddleja alternifolia]